MTCGGPELKQPDPDKDWAFPHCAVRRASPLTCTLLKMEGWVEAKAEGGKGKLLFNQHKVSLWEDDQWC